MQPIHESAEQLAWEATCHVAITSDVIWKLDAYRAALFLQHVARPDYKELRIARPHATASSQLSDAVESVSSNIGEGYSRATRADRRRFYNYAIGSTRECVTRYHGAQEVFSHEVFDHRLHLLARIRSLVLGLLRATQDDSDTKSHFQP